MNMNAKNFLMIGGSVLVVVGLGGMVGILGPTPDASIFGEIWWFDDAENWAHLVLGVVGLAVALAIPPLHGSITLLVGILALAAGVWGFISPDLLGAYLENPADNILHLAVGAWAVMSWMQGRKMSAPNSSMPPQM